jgi:hypothetical protein
MFHQVIRVIVFSLVLFLLQPSFQSANAVDVLWNPGVSNTIDGSTGNLVPGAKIRNTGLLVYKSNPDELIMKIIMSDSFEDRPFSGKGRNLAMWIYWPTDYCWSENKANCEGLYIVREPFNPSTYPSSKASEYVLIQKHNKASNVDVKPTSCKAPWWIESTYKSRDTWSFAISITCLGMPKEFGWYAYSQIDLGQKDIATDFTSVQTITYPFHDLAVNASKNGRSNSTSQSNKLTCVSASTKEGDFIDEQCSEGGKWAFQFCDLKPRSDLQILRSKKWVKLQTISGVKNIEECPDDDKYTGYYFFKLNGAFIGKHRIKTYGNKKYLPGYIDLDIGKKDSA